MVNNGEPTQLGPLQSPVGPVVLAVEDGVLTLARAGGRVLFRTGIRSRFTQLRFDRGSISFVLPGGMRKAGAIWLDLAPQTVSAAQVAGALAEWSAEADGITLRFGPEQAGQRVNLAIETG